MYPSVLLHLTIPGDHTGRVTPVPIPNTAVKPARADDSRKAKVGRCLDFILLHPSTLCWGEVFYSAGRRISLASAVHLAKCTAFIV